MLFQELAAGEDAIDVAKQLMGPEVIEHAGFFSTTFRVPGNSGLVGMIS